MKIRIFFHVIATRNYRQNLIASISTNDGRVVTDHEQKAAVLWQSFKDRLGVSDHPNILFNINYLPANTDLLSLEAPFTHEEIERVIEHMPNDKSPEPDGFNGHFMKNVGALSRSNSIN
jgi:hypothetical protein